MSRVAGLPALLRRLLAPTGRFVRQLQTVRAVGPMSAWVLTTEIFGWREIRNGRQLGALVGLAPAPSHSGETQRDQGITRAGNAHVRRFLIEAAWHHRPSYRNPWPTMRARWAKVDPALKDRGHAGNRRLHQQWCRLLEHRKNPLVADVAIARELAVWCWSL